MKPRSFLVVVFGYLVAMAIQIAGLIRYVDRLPNDWAGILLYIVTIVFFGLGAIVYLLRWASEIQTMSD
jgi:steroid 5-alpha reductase family enzyme